MAVFKSVLQPSEFKELQKICATNSSLTIFSEDRHVPLFNPSKVNEILQYKRKRSGGQEFEQQQSHIGSEIKIQNRIKTFLYDTDAHTKNKKITIPALLQSEQYSGKNSTSNIEIIELESNSGDSEPLTQVE